MFKKKKKKDIHEECWDLDYTMIDWLIEHLKVFEEDASKCINMEFHKFEYKGEIVPFGVLLSKLIDKLIELRTLMDELREPDRAEELKNEAFELLSLIFWCLWW